MLILSRKVEEDVVIDLRRYGLDLIVVKVLENRSTHIRLGFEAIKEIPIDRYEIFKSREAERTEEPRP